MPAGPRRHPVVTFDLFSALLDSRRGGSAAFDRLGRGPGWTVDAGQVYDHWDRLNKAAQRDRTDWVPFREHTADALERTYADLRLGGDPRADAEVLVAGMAEWPLWPDVAEGLPVLAAEYRVGLLSNVDDEIFVRTRAAALVEHDVALTSARLRAYKPGARIYTEASRRLGPMVHVATSARDVRGALEAGLTVVRLRRPGHDLDPTGPRPAYEASTIADLAGPLARAARRAVRSPPTVRR